MVWGDWIEQISLDYAWMIESNCLHIYLEYFIMFLVLLQGFFVIKTLLDRNYLKKIKMRVIIKIK